MNSARALVSPRQLVPTRAGGPLPTQPVVPADCGAHGRGTLADRLTLPDDWDSAETNEEIAEDVYR